MASQFADDADDLVDEFVCAITLSTMNDPVVLSDGHSYERADLETWLRDHDTSPKTGLKLDSKVFFPNVNLAKAISRWKETRPENFVSEEPTPVLEALQVNVEHPAIAMQREDVAVEYSVAVEDEPVQPSEGYLPCPNCTLHNDISATICEACEYVFNSDLMPPSDRHIEQLEMPQSLASTDVREDFAPAMQPTDPFLAYAEKCIYDKRHASGRGHIDIVLAAKKSYRSGLCKRCSCPGTNFAQHMSDERAGATQSFRREQPMQQCRSQYADGNARLPC